MNSHLYPIGQVPQVLEFNAGYDNYVLIDRNGRRYAAVTNSDAAKSLYGMYMSANNPLLADDTLNT